MEENNKKEKGFTVRIGPKLKKVLEKQKEIIKDATWNEVNASDFVVGEIIAKKIDESNIL